MALSIDDLFTSGTPDQVMESILDSLEAKGLPARQWRPGGALRTIVRILATMFAAFTLVMVAFIKSGFLTTSQGSWLTMLAKNVYNVERIEATFASGQIQLHNSGGGVFPLGIGECRVLWAKSPSIKKAYTNTQAFTLNPGDTLLIDFSAVEAGSASSAPPGEIVELETDLVDVEVTNPGSFIGTDAEKDEALRIRCLNKLASLSPRGPRGAYGYAITSAKRLDGSPVDINRYKTSPSSSTGVVDVWIASSSGAPTTEDHDAVVASIEENARPDTVTVNVYDATEIPLLATLTVWAVATPGVSAQAIEDAVQEKLGALIAAYPIGGIAKPPATLGYLWASEIEGACSEAHPSIYAVDGAIDLAITAGAVATFAAEVTVRIVS